MAKCLECEGEIELSGEVEPGEIIDCPDCGSEFEVKKVNPVELGFAPKEEEDWGE